MKKYPQYILLNDLVIPAGTEFKEWNGKFEAIIGIHNDACIYIYSYDDDLYMRPDMFRKE